MPSYFVHEHPRLRAFTSKSLSKLVQQPLALLILLLAPVISFGARSPDDVRILHFERVSLEITSRSESSTGLKASEPVTHAMRITALGQTFVATLAPTAKLNRLAKARGGKAITYRGQLQKRDKSWVRITQAGDNVHGLIWDGQEMYAIAPASEIGGSDGSVIFRLADTQTHIGEFCGTQAALNDGQAIYTALTKDLSAVKGAALEAQLRLQISLLTDAAFRTQFANDTAAVDAVITRLNNVDGIFSAQLGIEVQAALIDSIETVAGQSFSGITNPETLLENVAASRGALPQLHATGLTHFITGRDLNDSTVGLSFLGTICHRTYATTLSESRGRGTWFDSMVIAHEFGHSFNAIHDGDGECATAPKNLLMAAFITGSDQFSTCNVNRVQKQMQSAACLTPVPRPEVSLAANLGSAQHVTGEIFDWAMGVANQGGADATHVIVDLAIPSSLVIESATLAQEGSSGQCVYGGGTVTCSLDRLTANTSATLAIRLHSNIPGHYTLNADVRADVDADATNNGGAGVIDISSPQAATAESSSTQADASESGGGGSLMFDLIALCLGLSALKIGRRFRQQIR